MAALSSVTPSDPAACPPGFTFYVCDSTGFRGCCSIPACGSGTGCPAASLLSPQAQADTASTEADVDKTPCSSQDGVIRSRRSNIHLYQRPTLATDTRDAAPAIPESPVSVTTTTIPTVTVSVIAQPTQPSAHSDSYSGASILPLGALLAVLISAVVLAGFIFVWCARRYHSSSNSSPPQHLREKYSEEGRRPDTVDSWVGAKVVSAVATQTSPAPHGTQIRVLRHFAVRWSDRDDEIQPPPGSNFELVRGPYNSRRIVIPELENPPMSRNTSRATTAATNSSSNSSNYDQGSIAPSSAAPSSATADRSVAPSPDIPRVRRVLAGLSGGVRPARTTSTSTAGSCGDARTERSRSFRDPMRVTMADLECRIDNLLPTWAGGHRRDPFAAVRRLPSVSSAGDSRMGRVTVERGPPALRVPERAKKKQGRQVMSWGYYG